MLTGSNNRTVSDQTLPYMESDFEHIQRLVYIHKLAIPSRHVPTVMRAHSFHMNVVVRVTKNQYRAEFDTSHLVTYLGSADQVWGRFEVRKLAQAILRTMVASLECALERDLEKEATVVL